MSPSGGKNIELQTDPQCSSMKTRKTQTPCSMQLKCCHFRYNKHSEKEQHLNRDSKGLNIKTVITRK